MPHTEPMTRVATDNPGHLNDVFALLRQRGQSVAWLARQMGMNRSHLYQLHNGTRPVPDDFCERMIHAIALSLNRTDDCPICASMAYSAEELHISLHLLDRCAPKHRATLLRVIDDAQESISTLRSVHQHT